ncbi:MAG: 6,7-dimethyl-8-ribityllumazine synthase [Bacteroides sp.]
MSESSAFNRSQEHYVVRPEEHVVIFAAEWHSEIVDRLVSDAVDTLIQHGVRQVEIIKVPGSYELPQAVSMYFYGPLNATLAEPRDRRSYSAICFGCVIQGETPHFTFISEAVAQEIEHVACSGVPFPVMFGVLTANTVQQALARANGTHSKKGEEVALALLKMLDFRNKYCF